MQYRFLTIFFIMWLTGCASNDRISLVADKSQQALTRDGVPALISNKRHVVMLKPASSEVRSSSRPNFVLAVLNRGKKPADLRVSEITALSSDSVGKTVSMHVYSYEELKAEEISRQRWAAVGVALQGVSASMSAANAGYSNTSGSYSGSSYGRYSGGINGSYSGNSFGTYSARTYDSGKAYAAQQIASANTSASIEALRATGEQNLARLKNHVLKDNTVLPGEWIGGRIILSSPPKSRTGSKSYSISVLFGGELHTFQISQNRI